MGIVVGVPLILRWYKLILLGWIASTIIIINMVVKIIQESVD